MELEPCDICGSTNVVEINCKVICRNCGTILKSCADLDRWQGRSDQGRTTT